MPRTVPVSASVVPGNFETAALWNAQVKALNDFLTAPPVFAGVQTSTQSVANNTPVALTIDTENLDSDGGHSTVTNTSRYTATVPGTYLVLGSVAWASNATGLRTAQIKLNGTSVRGSQIVSASVSGAQWCGQCWAVVTMNGTTDFVEVWGNQTSGGTLATYAGSDSSSAMALYFLSR